MGLLALGPFLHAHYGPSQATGFHINGLETTALAGQTMTPAHDLPEISAPIEPESPAVGVVTSLPRCEENELFTTDTLDLLMVGFFSHKLFKLLALIWPWVPQVNPSGACAFRAGFLPPALAPPVSSSP